MGNPIAIRELVKSAFDDFIIPEEVAAPFTTIQNRKKVTSSLKALAGVERIMFKDPTLLADEFGPNGESVYESTSKDARFRFIGTWVSTGTTSGTYVQSTVVGDIFEAVFYGTGLNILMNMNSAGHDIKASIDGGAYGADLIPSTVSGILDGRNYGNNTVVQIASGLSLGWHNIKIRLDAANLRLYGVELVNERTDLAVLAGKGVAQGGLVGLSALSSSSFKDGVVGTRGARVVKYLEGSVLKSAVQEVGATSKFLSNAEHSIETPWRRFHYREFGANRADDLSTLVGSNSSRAFTLDDGLTTMTVKDATGNATFDGIEFLAAGSSSTPFFVTITFVGTGLDVLIRHRNLVTTVVTNVYVDGVLVGQLPKLLNDTTVMTKICSGLPYGTHTVKIENPNVAGQSPAHMYADMVVYVPKKPSIPDGCFQVEEYFVPADYADAASASYDGPIANGVIRKMSSRETLYSGTWQTALAPEADGGWNFFTTVAAGAYREDVIFGTGFNYNIPGGTGSGASSWTLTVDGVANLSGYTTRIITSGTAATYNPTTGLISIPVSAGVFTVVVEGLPLASHAVRITKVSGAVNSYTGSIDVITPAHYPDPAFKVGNLSLKAGQKYSPEKTVANTAPDLRKAKAWIFFDFVTGRVRASYNVSAAFSYATGSVMVFFEKPFKSSDSYVVVTSASSFETAHGEKRPNSIKLVQATSAGASINGEIYAVFYGELADE